jgi:hypothetical protein
MYAPGTSTIDVLGFQLYINDANSNSVPDNLVYNGQAIPSVLQATVSNLVSD